MLLRIDTITRVCANCTKVRYTSPRRLRSHERTESTIDIAEAMAHPAPTSPANFRLSDFDCIGFDLDNTLVKYNISNMVKLVYETLSHFLVEQKGYDPSHLRKPLNVDFLQKGLTIDYQNGNVLQLAPDGSINRASHGTKLLTEAEVQNLYGEEKVSLLTREFTQNMLDAWNGPISEKIRSVMDHFDVPVSLVFARCVDDIDARAEKECNNGTMARKYNLYQDITDGLVHMFQRDNFANNTGGFFPALKKNPELYLHKCSDKVRNWLKELKRQKKVYLVTGSHIDFASFTFEYCLEDDFMNLFDIVITFARKPGFFTGRRPFVSLVNGKEQNVVEPPNIHLGNVYSQGNWQDLYELFKKETCLRHPTCLYVGDNIIQDVFAPDEFTRCHSVAISEEMRSEGVGEDKSYFDELSSNTWGSYFYQKGGKCSLWCDIIKRHSVICVPNVDVLACESFDFEIQGFKCLSPDESKPVGFYPGPPRQ